MAPSDQSNQHIDQRGAQGPIGAVHGNVTQTFNERVVQRHYATLPRPSAAEIAAALACMDALPLAEVPQPAARLSVPARMPLRRNQFFVGREAELLALANWLKDGRVAAIATGIGGVGKTQLAVEFCYRYGPYFAGVCWLSFADANAVPGEIAGCAALLGINPESYETQDALVQAVCVRWAAGLPYLLVFDNCEDEALLSAWAPTGGACRVLVTSRRPRWTTELGVAVTSLAPIARAESIALLRQYRPDLADGTAALAAIAATLGDLPLALSLAGAYLRTFHADAQQYADELHAELLAHESLHGAGSSISLTRNELSVTLTFDKSLDRLDPQQAVDAAARALLVRAACLAPGEPFPRSILRDALAGTEDKAATRRAEHGLLRLTDLGLLELAGDDSLRIHRLVSARARQVISDDEALDTIEEALTNEGNRRYNAGYPNVVRPILPCLTHALIAAEPRGDARAAALLNTTARCEELLANYAAARSLYERALAIREQVLGPEHLLTAESLNNLALLMYGQGNYGAAKPLYERALAINEQVLGPEHPSTGNSLNNLALLLYGQGDYDAAKPLYERALAINEQVLGPEHPLTGNSLNNLASLYRAQGDYGAAKPLYERALAIREQALGPEHPLTGNSLNNLAGLYYVQGDYGAARSLYEHALVIREHALGLDHPETATSLNDLALLLKNQGDYGAAKPLYERALAINEQVLGPRHPSTATSLNNLALLCYNEGRTDEARTLMQRALAIYEQVLGSEHPDTQSSRQSLAAIEARLAEGAAAE